MSVYSVFLAEYLAKKGPELGELRMFNPGLKVSISIEIFNLA